MLMIWPQNITNDTIKSLFTHEQRRKEAKVEKTAKSSSGYIFFIILLVIALFQTWNDRYNDGYDAGYDKGYEEGDEHGYKNGHYDGEGEGYDQGYNDAFAKLEDIGTYEDGYYDGYLALVNFYESPNDFDYTVIPMLPVTSSFIDSVGYSPMHKVLLIQMNGENLYAYHDVSSYVFINLATAESPGSYFNSYIKNKYRCTKYY